MTLPEPSSSRHERVRAQAKRGLTASQADNPLGLNLDDSFLVGEAPLDPRVVAAIEGRLVVWFGRHSSDSQAENAEGSRDRQLSELDRLKPYPIEIESNRLVRIYAAGEGATGRSDREMFNFDFMPILESGNAGLVIVVDADRITRNMNDGVRFVGVCQLHNILVMVHGKVLDANNPHDEMQLYELFMEAARDSVRRTALLTEAKAKKAARGRVRNNTPTGLVHADPTNPAYRSRLFAMAASLGRPELQAIVEPESLAKHKAVTEDDGQDFYILPFPDAEVYRAIELTFEWLFECRSLRGVIERIRTGYGDWPSSQTGRFPMFRAAIFHHTLVAKWRPATKGRVRRWLRSKALYGIYAFESPRYAVLAGAAEIHNYRIHAPDAFPSFRPSADYQRVTTILGKPKKRYGRHDSRGRKRYPGARNFALPAVHCAQPMGDGPCGFKLGAVYEPDGTYRYMATHCGVSRDHGYSVSPAIEGIVLDVVLDALDAERISQAVQDVRLTRASSMDRVRRLRGRLESAQSSARSARSFAVESRRRADEAADDHSERRYQNEAERYRDLALAHQEAADEMTLELEELEDEARSLAELADDDIVRLRQLAGNLNDLLAACQAVEATADRDLLATDDKKERLRLENYEGRVRAVVEALGIRVRVRPLDEARIKLEVVFPRGGVVTREVYAQYGRGSQVERLWAWHRTRRDHAPPKEVVNELEIGGKPGGLGPDAVWTPGLVLSAALLHERAEPVPPPPRATWSLSRIAKCVDEDEEAVFGAALRGELGPGRIEEGKLMLEPDKSHLDAAFLDYARREVARRRSWPLEQTRLLTEVADEEDVDWHEVAGASERFGQQARDRSGRVYCRADRTPLTREAVLSELLRDQPEAIRQLDQQYWMPLAKAREEFPGSRERIADTCDHVITHGERRKGSPLWVYVDEEVRDRLQVTSLEDAVRARARELGRSDLDPDDFVTRVEAQTTLRERFSGFHNGAWYRALEEGNLVEVRARHPDGSARQVYWVHCPATVLQAEDEEVARRWLKGRAPAA